MLKDLVKKVDNMFSQVGSFIREIETIKRNQIDILEHINTNTHAYTSITEHSLNRFINRLDTLEQNRINEFENRPIGIIPT